MSDLQSVSRALRILAMLRSESELGVSEVATALGVSSSTAHRLFATLEAEGYVRHTAHSRRYEAGEALRSVRLMSDIERYTEAARWQMATLRDKSGETVHLATLAGTATRFLAAAESPQIMKVGSRVGQRLPAHKTAAGKLLLSALTSEELSSLYQRELENSANAITPEQLAALRVELEQTRSRGVGVNHEESETGVAALAVPVVMPNGEVRFSLTISAPASRIHPESGVALSERERELLSMLRESAAAIEEDLRTA